MDTEAVKACTSKGIVYPTGGYTDFDFETHDVNYTLGKIGIGGLRVKKITDNDENGNQKECAIHSQVWKTKNVHSRFLPEH